MSRPVYGISLLVFSGILYLAYTFFIIDLPGIQDEWFSFGLLENLRTALASGEWNRVSLMQESYVGSFNYFLCLPFVWFFPALRLVRLAGIVFCGVSLFFIYGAVKNIFTSRALAVLTVFLVCTNISFLNAVPVWIFREETTQINLLWMGIFCLVRWNRTKKYRWICGAGLLWGFAFWAKVMFASYMLGVCVMAVFAVLSSPRDVGRCCWVGKKPLLFCVLFFVLGAMPGLFNYAQQAVDLFRQAAVHSWDSGWNNLSVWQKLGVRFVHLWEMLVHDAYTSVFDENVLACRNYVQAGVFVLAVLFSVPKYFVRWLKNPLELSVDAGVVFCFVCIVGIVGTSILAPGGVCGGHLLLVVPLVQILCAVWLCDVYAGLSKFFTHKKLVAALGLCLLVLPDAFAIEGNVRMHDFLVSRFCIGPLSRVVSAHPGIPVLDFRTITPEDVRDYMRWNRLPGADFEPFSGACLSDLPVRFFVITDIKKEYENMPAILALYLSGGVWDESFVNHMRRYYFKVLEKWQSYYNWDIRFDKYTYLYLVECWLEQDERISRQEMR